MKQTQRREDLNRWSKHPDFKFQTKNVGRFRVELFYGTERGGVILIWAKVEKDTKRMTHIWPRSDDETLQMESEVNFWDWSNAKFEYRTMTTVRDVIALMWRNR